MAEEIGLSKNIIIRPKNNDKMAGTNTGSNLDTPDNSIVFISLFFCNFTKKSIPENKKIKIDSSIIVFGVLLRER